MTREQLAEECAKLGAHQLTFAAITNIETGRKNPRTGLRRRDVNVDELLVFAYALAVPPLLLMFPVGEVDEVPTPPNWKGIHPQLAWKWATGEEAPGYVREDGKPRADRSRIGAQGPTRFEAWGKVTHPIKLYQRLRAETEAFQKADGRRAYLRDLGQVETEEGSHVIELCRHHLGQVADILEEMMRSGIRVPAYTEEFVDKLRATGILTHPEMVPLITPPDFDGGDRTGPKEVDSEESAQEGERA